jgi:hypothetical protein
VKESGHNMGEYNWIKNTLGSIGWFVESFGYSETKLPSDAYLIPEMRINNTYPYTFEQTVRVTHYNKPKRRDPARKANRR